MSDHIERLREMLAKATPGPWSENYLYSVLRYGRKNLDETGPEDGDEKLIVAMHNAFPALLALWEAARNHESVRRRCGPFDEYEATRKVLQDALANLEKLPNNPP